MLKWMQNVIVSSGDAWTDGHDLKGDHIAAPQIFFSAGLTGTFKLQGCNDNSSWEDTPNSTLAVAGSAGHQGWNISNFGFQYARIYFVYSSGSGSWSTLFNSKGGGR